MACCTRTSILSFPITLFKYATALSGVSSPSSLRFIPTDAAGGSTLNALLPSIFVTAQVVRIMAFNSPPDFLHTAFNNGRKHQRFAKIMRIPKPEYLPSVSNISFTGLVNCALNGCFSIFTTASESCPSMVCVGGMEAWPPPLFIRSSTFMPTFSPIPTTAQGLFTPGNTFSTTAPPSSSTNAGLIPFCSR